ncbi:mitochondrial 37S ribosomal protein MRP2 [Spizellomyces punctatus DAOM BR117]|uniref:Ribosomal protein S14 n=1 Tax=Spizellomyces punctatus (strain DAOM BR117) TaxID=645134 RepID=A0A0L0HJ07_SPIPD|nr:mitochondrial 37S ribosomal protein MRP2 [Spizellomyces punctatus DAOM BR117]KND01451.1 hypothetical protein SPPG_03255 [Spizellomyces punctatus DAOM BR117]|eukprot:XP_016609490.1 hypothetical protein SPPG_03255 [Spizellomyces punctatus DAOM BR117]
MPLSNIIRDKLTRLCVAENEITREALRLIARDKSGKYTLNDRIRAQLELQKLPKYSRPTAVHNRCVESGKTRGHVTDFKVSRIVFRERALAGEIPGVKKSCW